MSQQRIVIGLGELLWDVFPDGKRPGGAPANVAFQANQLGCYGMVISRVGTDADGDELCQFLDSQSLDRSLVQQDSAHPTGKVTVSVTNGQPSYIIHENVAWDFIERTDDLISTAQRASGVCFGTLAQRSPTSRETVQEVVRNVPEDALRVFDVNLRQQFYTKEIIAESLHLANVMKLNDEEVRILGPLLDLSTDMAEFSQQVRDQYDLKLICVTRGANGCLVTDHEQTHEVPGHPVQVADTVGAGDAFTAGFIFAQLEGWPVGVSGRFANRVGGLVASSQGAMPDLRDRFAVLIEETRQQL